ncbi:MAG TPA: arylsulfatase [Candidatus Didemnitutus sp.]|nr:arylsulfatase [Candidatus Didemnitutus sp.]
MRPPGSACFALLSVFAVAVAADDRPPNVVFILADDLGYADVGCYGQKTIATPNIDRLAADGVRFTQFYAGSTVCAPSRSVLITGQHTGHTTIRGNAKFGLRAEDHSVAEMFKQAGYATAIIGKWGLGAEGSDATPSHKGFDYFFGYLDQTHAHNYYPTFLIRNDARVPLRNVVPNEGQYGQGVATTRVDYSAALIADEAVAFLRRQTKERPFFLLYAPTLPHANNEGKPDGMEDPGRDAFDKDNWPGAEKGFAAMVTRLDRDVGRIVAELEKLGVAGDTLVIFTSDNGPHAEGGHDPQFFHSSGPLTGHKRDLTEGGIREPFIARWPGHIKAGVTSEHVGYFGDFFATAAELTGVRTPPNLDSLSFLPALLGRTQAPHEFLYWEFYEESGQAVRFGDWKAIRRPMLTGRIALYDLKSDQAEQHDVASAHPDLVTKAKAYMDQSHVPSPLWPDKAK